MATSDLYALIRGHAPDVVAKIGSMAALRADILGPDDRVLPVAPRPSIPEGHVEIDGMPVYRVHADNVEIIPQTRALTAEEKAERAATARAAAYPPIGDQLDAIAKSFAALDRSALPAETQDWLARLDAVKAAHPKPRE